MYELKQSLLLNCRVHRMSAAPDRCHFILNVCFGTLRESSCRAISAISLVVVSPAPKGASCGGQAFVAVALASVAGWQALLRVLFPLLHAQGLLAARAASVLVAQGAGGW